MTMPTTAIAHERQRLVERDCRPAQPAQHLSLLPAAPADTRPRRRPPFRDPTAVWSMMRSNRFGLDRAIGRRRHGLARLCQFGVAGIVERRPGAAHLRDPGVEIAGRHRFGDEPHLGKAVAAEICREAGKFARLVREQVEVGGHAAHRVDLAAELRHEERIHHRRRGEAEVDRGSGRHDQLIDRGNALIGVDEQPFPIERNDIHPKRRWRSRGSAPADRAGASRSR